MSDVTRRPRISRRVHPPAAVPLVVGCLGMAGSNALSLGSLTMPGPGLWPFIVSACLVVASIPLLITQLGAAGQERFDLSGSLPVVAGAVSVAIFVFAFERLGLILPAFVLLLFWLRVLGTERWRTSVATAALAPAALYLVFGTLLDVPLPDDIVLFWS